jgi:hypothetical protein
MMIQIKLFLLVLSIVYLVRFIVEFVIRLTQENPDPMKMSKIEQVSQLLAISYIITYILI